MQAGTAFVAVVGTGLAAEVGAGLGLLDRRGLDCRGLLDLLGLLLT